MVAVEAAARQVIERIESAKDRVPANQTGYDQPAYYARQRLKHPPRGNCIRIGGAVTPIFLRLDKEIDLFAADWIPGQSTMGLPLKLGNRESLHAQLDAIRKIAERLRDEAATGIRRTLAQLAELREERES